jgi:uncharacterized protein (TIGR02117 family)
MRRIVAVLVRSLALVIVVLGLGALVPRPFFMASAGVEPAESQRGAMRTVLVISSQIHTDIAFPADPDVLESFDFMPVDGLDPSMPRVAYVIAGWGGRSFYIETPTWADLKPGPVFKALTIDNSVMHMSLAGEIDSAHPQVLPLTLDAAAFERLLASVSGSFTLDGEERPIVIEGVQYGPNDLFYEANGWFNALVGCNVWTAKMLRDAGVTTGWWTPLPVLLTGSLRLHNGSDANPQLPLAR